MTEEGEILHLDIQIDYCHDMKLFRKSRRDLSKAREILADSGYQGLMKLYSQAKTPIKSSKLHPLTDEDKAYNRALSSRRIKVEMSLLK